MKQFIAKFADKIDGVLCGLDRLVLRGELRALYIKEGGGIKQYLKSQGLLIKQFGQHVEQVSERLKKASLAAALEFGRVIQYLPSAARSKEQIARRIAAEQNITSGLVCVLTSVEPCMSFRAVPNRASKHLDIKLEQRKCLHLYHYWIDPLFGMMNARIQTWFPFRIQICLNGREWLARQMDASGLPYVRQDNCFPWIADFNQAQQLMDQQLDTQWVEELTKVRERLNPVHGDIFEKYRVNYYWTTHQSEWAIDIRFPRSEDLKRLYPLLVRHGMSTFGSADVLRFLGKRVCLDGSVQGNCSSEICSDMKHRAEGIRIKHSVDGNSVKGYDKAHTDVGSIFRGETTITYAYGFKSYRPKEGDSDGPRAWRPMRRGMADLYRRAEVSQAATERYLDALASLQDDARLQELLQPLQTSHTWKGGKVRGLQLFGKDHPLAQAVSRGEFNLQGFRNRDLQRLLYSTAAETKAEAKKRSAAITRQLRLLRAHGLIRKIPGTHRYLLTKSGRTVITAVLAASQAMVSQLAAAA